MKNEIMTLSALEIGGGISRGDFTSQEITQAYLDAIEANEFKSRIYSFVSVDRAMLEAKQADARYAKSKQLGLLDGVPISWKDLFDTKDIPTEAGTNLLKDRLPQNDAEVVRFGAAAGTICLGKTHMSELAFSGLGLNPITETSPCVNDFEAVSGGSSSGAAASVAFGLAPLAIGSDTGGSVRIPASWNDLVGLKTTSGDISLSGVVPLCSKFDTVGPLCRTVADAAASYDMLKGQAITGRTGKPVRNIKLLKLETIAQDELEASVDKGFQRATQNMVDAGVQIESLSYSDLDEMMGLSGILFTYEAYNQWSEQLENEGSKMFPQIYDRFMQGKKYSFKQYSEAWNALRLIRKDWAKRVEGYDGVILPSSPILPPNLSWLLEDESYYIRANLLALRNTRIANLLGLCSMTLPTAEKSVGLSIMGKAFGEDDLIRTTLPLEELTRA